MRIEEHIAKAQRIEHSLARCTTADYETVIEAAMLAGTHWFNVLLHRTNLLPEVEDAMHAEFLSAHNRRNAQATVPDALRALDDIERLRAPFVRGNMPGGKEAAAQALACLARLRNHALATTVP